MLELRGDILEGEHLGEVDAHGERSLAAPPLLDQRVQDAGLAESARRVEQRAGSRAGEVQEPAELCVAADELTGLDQRAEETGSPTPLWP
jgi:hypothetical protein